MAKKDAVTGIAANIPLQPVESKETAGAKVVKNPDGKKKKKHQSAMAAAAQASSVVSKANARSSGDIGFRKTGTNLSYNEDDGVL